jgi:actin-related protein 2
MFSTQFENINSDAGENSPRCVIPTIAGIREDSDHNDSLKNNDANCKDGQHFLFGNEALDPKLASSRIYPMENGIVRDWETMGHILEYGFHEVTKNCQEEDSITGSKILLTEPTLNPIDNKKKVLEYMFESMNFGAINLSNQSLLVLYARGLVSGIVVECGEGITQVVPIYEGVVPHHLIKRHGVKGKTITTYLRKLLQLQGFNAKLASDIESLRSIKEKLCYASCDLREDRSLARETTVLVENYSLPDGTTIKVGQERFEATEAYFDPSLVDMECQGLSDFVFDTIQECEIDCRQKLYEHIVLS